MLFTRLKRVAAACLAAGWLTGAVFSGCTTFVRLPTGRIDVSEDGVFIDFPGALVTVTHEQIVVDLLGLEVEFDND